MIRRSHIFDKRVENNFNLSSIETFHNGVVNKLKFRKKWNRMIERKDLLDCFHFF